MPNGHTAFNARQIALSLPRAKRALKLREAGKTWVEVGVALGVSAQRAHVLAKKAKAAYGLIRVGTSKLQGTIKA